MMFICIGSTQYLVEAEMLQEEVIKKLMRSMVKPRYPREWLGRDEVKGIRRLVTSSSVGHADNLRSKCLYNHFLIQNSSCCCCSVCIAYFSDAKISVIAR
jgi:hypothetical protein